MLAPAPAPAVSAVTDVGIDVVSLPSNGAAGVGAPEALAGAWSTGLATGSRWTGGTSPSAERATATIGGDCGPPDPASLNPLAPGLDPCDGNRGGGWCAGGIDGCGDAIPAIGAPSPTRRPGDNNGWGAIGATPDAVGDPAGLATGVRWTGACWSAAGSEPAAGVVCAGTPLAAGTAGRVSAFAAAGTPTGDRGAADGPSSSDRATTGGTEVGGTEGGGTEGGGSTGANTGAAGIAADGIGAAGAAGAGAAATGTAGAETAAAGGVTSSIARNTGNGPAGAGATVSDSGRVNGIGAAATLRSNAAGLSARTGSAGFVPAGFVPAGIVPAGFVPAGFVPAGFVPAGFVPAGFVPAGTVASGTAIARRCTRRGAVPPVTVGSAGAPLTSAASTLSGTTGSSALAALRAARTAGTARSRPEGAAASMAWCSPGVDNSGERKIETSRSCRVFTVTGRAPIARWIGASVAHARNSPGCSAAGAASAGARGVDRREKCHTVHWPSIRRRLSRATSAT